MRPNDDFLDQILALDNENQKRIALEETPLVDTLPKLSDLPDLPKPWHYEFWSDIPDDLPFSLVHLNPVIPKLGSSKAASKRYRESQRVASI